MSEEIIPRPSLMPIPAQREAAYKAYFNLRDWRRKYQDAQSLARRENRILEAEDHGFAAAKVNECMEIVRDTLNLTFETY